SLARFFVAEPAFVELHVASGSGDDKHLATLFLGRLLVIPAHELRARFENHHIAPSGFAVALRFGFDGDGLQFPELFGVGKVTSVLKQIGRDGTGILLQWKERRTRRDGASRE